MQSFVPPCLFSCRHVSKVMSPPAVSDFPQKIHLDWISFSTDSHKSHSLSFYYCLLLITICIVDKYMVVSCLPWVQRGANTSLPPWLWLCLHDDEVESFHPYVLYPLWYRLALNYALSFFTPSDDLSLAAVVPHLCVHTAEETDTETFSFDISTRNKLPCVSARC